VTCLCLTRNRREWLPQAIRSYQAQTYPRRELLIVADGADVRDLVPTDDPSVRLLEIEEGSHIGDKRNFGCSRATGELIAHWDDDDFSEPGRVDQQVQFLARSGRAVVGYHSIRFTDGARWWLFCGNPINALGTSLIYRRDWWGAHKFPTVQIGEDNLFIATARKFGEFESADGREMMYARMHPGNTSPKSTAGRVWQRI
jgi:glycosyltransferase involved in cell wall biosynthesis